MATNKKKDAASLFELIDKSTLKVPKTGALKIPSWYSSKTNPPTQSTSNGVHVTGAASAAAAPTVRQLQPQPIAKPESKPEPKPEILAAPVHVPAATSTPAPQLTPKTIAPFGSVHTEKPPAMTPIPPQKGVFAPVVPASPNAKNKVIWLSAACGLVALVLLIVIIGRLGRSGATTPPANPHGQAATSGYVAPPDSNGVNIGGTHVAGGGAIDNGNLTGANPNPGNINKAPTTTGGISQVAAPAKGTIEDSKKVDWSREPKGLQYIMIASYSAQREDLARKSAELLADNGVDVVLLRTKSDAIRIFMRQGFPPTARTESEAAIAKIRKIGELHPDFKKTNTSVFASPYRAELNFASGK
jgi:hypothetical protein